MTIGEIRHTSAGNLFRLERGSRIGRFAGEFHRGGGVER